jgi:hypothetical protein
VTSNAKDEHKNDQCDATPESVTQQQNTQAITQAMTEMEAAASAQTAPRIMIKPTEVEWIIDSGVQLCQQQGGRAKSRVFDADADALYKAYVSQLETLHAAGNTLIDCLRFPSFCSGFHVCCRPRLGSA